MAFANLPRERVTVLAHALVSAGFADAEGRRLLFGGLNPRFVASLPMYAVPFAQVLGDLDKLNAIERLADGTVPLEQWLQNAVVLTDTLPESRVFRAALADVMRNVSGQPTPGVTKGTRGKPKLADPAKLPESKERIVHRNDMVPYAFLALGSTAGTAVARLSVPRYDNGQRATSQGVPVTYLGTGWLIARDVLVTNHHVINARNDGEPAAAAGDLELQAKGTIAEFDYDTDTSTALHVAIARIELTDSALDYALLRLTTAVERAPLRVAARPLMVTASSYIPVNIIQHPQGKPKRIAIRNNLVTAADGTSVRYFTDTMPGSSGSPVFNDAWEVIALHRGSEDVEGVRFQGRDTAWVNVGTPITAILEHLRAEKPGLLD